MSAWRQIEAGMRLQKPSPFVNELYTWWHRLSNVRLEIPHCSHPEMAPPATAAEVLYFEESVPNLRLWTGARHVLMMELKDQ